jgi:hypothetical protein
MNSLHTQIDDTALKELRFNVIGCGYCVEKIVNGNLAKRYWPMCMNMNTIKRNGGATVIIKPDGGTTVISQ